jgi:cell division cycle 14
MILPLHSVLDERLYITQGVDCLPQSESLRVFVPNETIHYSGFCDDFGPMNLACVAEFIKQLDFEFQDYPECQFFYCVEDGRRNLTNALFLVGSYMVVKLGQSVDKVCETFSWIGPEFLEGYRDATHCDPDFELTLRDCWAGLAKAKKLGWFDYASAPGELWGMYDIEEYLHYDNPFNGDLHEVVPGRFIAFMGPADLGKNLYRDNEHGWRRFSPKHYSDVFADFNVKQVVRLNEPEYNGQDFERHDIQHHSLEFEDCTSPPPEVVEAFFSLVDQSQGAIAVHCKAGLGRTGTLIALYLMRYCGFSAREAMGWLRIVRPGSVIGEQQHYLCAVELQGFHARRMAAAARRRGSVLDMVRERAAQVAAGMERRGSTKALMALSLMSNERRQQSDSEGVAVARSPSADM